MQMLTGKQRLIIQNASLNMLVNVSEFCGATSIHGLKYVTEDRRHWLERIIWFLGCSLGVYGAVWLMGQVWMKYSTSPTITSVESTHYPIWNIPFPAVTICNVNKVHLSSANELYRKLGLNITLKEDDYYTFVQQLAEIIQPEKVEQFKFNISKLLQVLKEHDLSMDKLMLEVTQPCDSMMIKCKWRGELKPCKELFTMHKTDSGFCCSFNYHPPDRQRDRSKPLLRVNGAGYLTGLSMLMDPRLEDYYAALFSFYGIQVQVHPPLDYPNICERGIILAPKKEAFMQVTAETTYATPQVRSLDVKQRQCLFDDESGPERSLGSSDYSFSNCLIRCKLQHLKQICNCTPYFYPSSEDTRECDLLDVKCLADNRHIFNNLKSPTPILGLADNENAMSCDCHPTCMDVEYSTEMSQGEFFKSEYDRTHFFKEVTITNHSILHVYFKGLSSIRYRRDRIYNWNDLLASFGGIVGLCLGCSLLSLLELIYFFTLRPACNKLQSKSQEASNKTQQHDEVSIPNKTSFPVYYPYRIKVTPAPRNWLL
ncbi:sodium channel protein Nach-like [Anabrus simplex]|uniref:sodium channel protein Nach-like n=1 Tax=Anabrus simplex TaxID=316456 RepID=UPI0035A2927B